MAEDIPHYKNDPVTNVATAPELKLYRPQINFYRAIIFIIVHVIISFIGALVWTMVVEQALPQSICQLLLKVTIILCVTFFLTLRFSLIWCVRVYQRYAKSETRLRCCMTPSCSEYAILALKKYGAIIGGIKTFKRLLRCHPPGGIDYP